MMASNSDWLMTKLGKADSDTSVFSLLITGVSSMTFYYTSHDLLEIQNWYSNNLNMTVERGVDWVGWVITLIAANGTVEFRPFHPQNMTYNPASFIPHLLEEFDGRGLSYTFNFNTSLEVDRYACL